jgi:hypothetical protein
MVEVIIDKRNDTVTIEGPLYSHMYLFRSFSKNNKSTVPTYVLHVNDDDQLNIKITLPQCNTIITEIPKKKEHGLPQ